MLYLKVDCSGCNSQAELCVKICTTLSTISKVTCSVMDDLDFDESYQVNLDCLNDCITSYYFLQYSCMLIIYNFAQVRPLLGDLTDNFISIFERMHNEYPRNFLYEIYEDEKILLE